MHQFYRHDIQSLAASMDRHTEDLRQRWKATLARLDAQMEWASVLLQRAERIAAKTRDFDPPPTIPG